MKLHFPKKLILAFSLLFLNVQAHADQWYHVEFIVFKQLDLITDEQWPQMNEVSNDFLTPNMATAQIQPASTQSLLNVVSRLNHSPRYQVQYHDAWQQPIMQKRQAKPIRIHTKNDLIDGTIRLYKSTYLHAELNLWLKQNMNKFSSQLKMSLESIDTTTLRNPNLKESRRIRSKKLYFFDHPKMGALLKLTPIKTPANIHFP